jgi:hypothetical protein
MLRTDGFLKKCLIWLSLISVAEYALYHLEYIFSGTGAQTVLGGIRYYLTEGWEFILPAIMATLMLIMQAYTGLKSSLIFGALTALSRIFFYLPWYYMYYIYNVGFDSIESIFFSLLTSIAFSLVAYIEALIFFGATLGTLHLARRKYGDSLTYLKAAMEHHDAFDITRGAGMLLGVISLFAFLRRGVVITIDTVDFFIKHGSNYRSDEVISIIADYLVALLSLILTHLIISWLKKKIIEARVGEQTDATDAEGEAAEDTN